MLCVYAERSVENPAAVGLQNPYGFYLQTWDLPYMYYCKLTLDREHRYFCNRCRQALDWKDFFNAIIIFPSWS